MISKKGKFIFFHNPKAAGNSVANSLLKSSRFECISNSHNPDLLKFLSTNGKNLWPNHIHPRVIRMFLGEEEYQKYFKFSFVRDPRARLVSFYFYTKQKEKDIYDKTRKKLPHFNQKIMESESFESWVLEGNCLPPPQTDFFTDKRELILDFIGKTEHLSDELRKIQSIIGISELDVNQINQSKHKNYNSYFTPEMNSAVQNKYAVDFDLFGYQV